MLLNSYKDQLKTILKNGIENIELKDYELLVEVKKEKIPFILSYLKNNTYSQFKVLTDIIVSDHPEKEKRFTVVYSLLSVKFSTRIHIKSYVSELDFIDSVEPVFKAAN
jgi:NADH:ubiquinone oxidoreductase subunit C